MIKHLWIFLMLLCFFARPALAQVNFSEETKKFISYSDSVIVIKNALLIDGRGNPARPHQTVIVRKGIISWIGDDAKAKMPETASIIDMDGKVLMPGLVMLHEHMYISASSMAPRYLNLRQLPFSFPRLYLAAGATTIRTCGSVEPYSDLRIKKDIDLGFLPGPSIELTAPYVEGKESLFPQMKENKTPEEAAAFVNYWADQGFTSFKAYKGIDQATLKAAIDAAHKRNLKITGHLCAVTYREAAGLGIDNLEHGFLVSTDFVTDKKTDECPSGPNGYQSLANLDTGSDEVKSFIRFMVDKKVGITSSLAVFEAMTTTRAIPPNDVLDAMSPDTRDYYLNNLAKFKASGSLTFRDSAFINASRMEKMYYDMGGLLTVGTDPTGNGGVLAGYGTWRAIELLVEADGFSPLEAIKIATLNGAIALGFDKTIGTIDVGKSADLLIIDGDPSKSISDLRKVTVVFKQGVGYDSRALFASVQGKVGFY